jgi:menaquinone-dependent protoporphyrinogen oxidase
MKHILVSYATMAGSSQEVAQAVGEELTKHDCRVDVLPLHEVENLEAYDALVLGAPMIMGWHRDALAFLRRNYRLLQTMPVAIFVLAMSLTETGEKTVDGISVTVDEKLPKPAKELGKLNFRERYAQLSSYLRPVLKTLSPAKPVKIGIFGGRMEYGRLKWWAVLFAMLIIKAPAGDKRNWELIRAWAAELPKAFQFEPHKASIAALP